MDSGYSILLETEINVNHTVRLLVSVKNAIEAKIALDCGIDILDVKAPRRGPLGRPSLEDLRKISELTSTDTVYRSFAWGELRDLSPEHVNCPSLPENFNFFKLGLSQLASNEKWPALWKKQLQQFAGFNPVAVAYGDFPRCAAPHPETIMEVGQQLGCQFFLIDTFSKIPKKNIFSYQSADTVQKWIEKAKNLGMKTVIAGSITNHEIKRCVAIAPDYIGVRGAVCSNGRETNLEIDKLNELIEILRAANGQAQNGKQHC